MTLTRKLVASLAAGAALTLPALAQTVAIDVNADGMYSFTEVQAALPEITDADFAALDTNGDGLLDADEIRAGEQAGLLPG